MGDQPQGTGAPEAPQGGEEPQYVTVDQLNKAITARFGEFTKKSSAVLDDRFSIFEKKLIEALPKQPETGTSDDKSIENHPLFKGMAKKLGDLEERARVAEEQTAAEKARAKDVTKRQFIAESLAGIGVKDAVRLKHAVRSVADEIDTDESGEGYVWKSKDGAVDFASGLDTWKKTDDAKIYLASPDSAQPPQGRQQQQRVSPFGAPPPQNVAELSFEDKLALTAQQLEKAGIG